VSDAEAKARRRRGAAPGIGAVLVLLLAAACARTDEGAPAAPALEERRPLEVTYVANAGYIVAHETRAVLIDALFAIHVAPGAPPRLHDHLSSERLAVVLAAPPPFDRVDRVLVTHAHDDHFTADAVVSFLSSNKGATLVCPGAVAEAVRAAPGGQSEPDGRTEALDPDRGANAEARSDGIPVVALGLPHAGRSDGGAGHNAYLVRLGPYRFLHLGDAAVSPGAFAALDPLFRDGIDVVFAPYWFLSEPGGIDLLRERIRPRHVVVTHVNRGNRDEITSRVAALPAGPPDFTLFDRIMERRYF